MIRWMFTHFDVSRSAHRTVNNLTGDPTAEQVQMPAVLRRMRYGSLLAFYILLLCAAGRNPTEIAS